MLDVERLQFLDLYSFELRLDYFEKILEFTSSSYSFYWLEAILNLMIYKDTIEFDEILDEMVVDHEPKIALFGGVDGLDFYRIIFKKYSLLIKEKGFMAFEFGYDQKDALENLIKELLPNHKYEFLKDYNNKYRMLFIYNN